MYVCEISFSPADLFLYELLLSAEHATATAQTAPTCHSWNGNTKFQTAQFQFFVLDLPQVHYLIIKFCTCTAVPILFHCPPRLALTLKSELATYTIRNVRKFEGQCMYWGSFSGRACAHQQLAVPTEGCGLRWEVQLFCQSSQPEALGNAAAWWRNDAGEQNQWWEIGGEERWGTAGAHLPTISLHAHGWHHWM